MEPGIGSTPWKGCSPVYGLQWPEGALEQAVEGKFGGQIDEVADSNDGPHAGSRGADTTSEDAIECNV